MMGGIGMVTEEYRITKILNNNVVLALENGKEKIIFSRGIGFKGHVGGTISNDIAIEKIFSLDDKENSNRFNELIERVDGSIVGLCEEVIYMIDKELGEELDEKIHIALTDHIAFTLMRLKENNEITNPFLIETQTLYKKEFEVAKKVISVLEKRIGIDIPDGEVGFIALHIHSAIKESFQILSNAPSLQVQ
jgi:transcriptional antiterminator